MERAVNPNTGEVVFLVNNQWVKPAQTARNPKTGEMAYLVGGAWQVVKPIPMGEVEGAAPISPEELLTPPTETPEEIALKEKTKKYEAGTTMGERAKRDIQRGVIALQKMPAELQVSSIQKEIERIRSGQAGRTDTMTGEFIPMSPEEEEAALAALQARQAEALKEVQKRQAEMRAIPGRPVTEAISEAKTFGEAMKALSTDPLGAMAGFSLESLPQMAPALVAGAVTRRPEIAALGMGGTSFTSELSNSVFEYLQDNGIDINDSNAVLKALDDPKMFKEAYDFALKRGAIIGTLDAASAGLASKALVPKKLIGSPKAREAVNIAIAQPASQIISGAGGEAAAQLATYGEIRKPGAVVAEAIGEGPTSLAETAAFGGRRIYEEFRSKEAEAPEVEAAKPPVKKAAERIEPTIEPEVKEEAPKEVKPAFAAEEIEDTETPALKLPEAPAVVADQVEMKRLEGELAKVQARQMDPMLTLDDPRFEEFQRQESDIKAKLAELRGEATDIGDLYDQLVAATPTELKKIDVPLNRARELYIRLTEDQMSGRVEENKALETKLNKLVNKLGPQEEPTPAQVTPPKAPEPTAEATVDLSRYAEIMQRRDQGKTLNEIQEESPDLDVINTVSQGLASESERKTKKLRDEEVGNLLRRMMMEDRSPKEIPAIDQDIERLKTFKQINTLLKKLTSDTSKSDRKAIDKQVEPLIKAVTKQPMGRFVPEAALDAAIEGLIRTNPKSFIDYYGDDGPRVKLLLRKFSSKDELRRWYNNTIQPQINKIQKSLVTSKTPTIKLDEPYTLNYLLQKFDEVKAETVTPKEEVAKPEVKPAKPTKEEQAAINRERQAKKREEAAAKKAAKAAPKAKPVEKVEEVEEVTEEEEVAAPAAEVETVKVEREYSDDDLKEQLKRFEVGNFTLPKTAGTGAEGREAADEMNQRYKDIYKEAARVFLESPITAKPGKLELTDGLTGIAPRPIVKKITPKFKTFDDQIKNLEPSAAKQDIRYYLNGVFLNKTKNAMVVTDGHRMAVWKDPNFDGMPAAEGDQIMSFKREFIDGKYPDYTRVIPDKHDKDKTRVEAESLGNYARGVNKAHKFISKDTFSAMRLRFGPRSVLVNSKYIVDMTDIFRRFGYDTFDMSIGIDPKNPTTGTKIYATSPDEKLVQVIMPIADRHDSKFASYSIPGVKEVKEVKEVIETSEKQKKEAEEKRAASIAAEEKAVQVRIDSAKQTGRFDDFIDNWVATDNIDNALRDLSTKNFEYEKRFEPRADLIEQMIEDGYKLSRDGYGNRVLQKDALRFNEEILSQTGLDYAQYLLAKKAPLQENLMADTRKVVSKLKSNIDVDRDEVMQAYSNVRSKGRRAIKEVAKYGSDIPMQRELNKLLGYEQELKDYLDATAPLRNSAKDFLAKATKELADENISDDVFNFISEVYRKQPNLLEGLRLSVRSRKEPGRSTGNFAPLERIITLWKDGIGIEDPKTIRHEMTHTLEQMMPPSAQKAIAEAWTKAFERAMKKNIDTPSQSYFEAVLLYLDDPTEKSYAKAISLMPDYSFYQYMNPSEFWAVNAENLMGAQMGSGWDRFKKTVRKLFEMLKSFFGFDNNYVVHREFDKVINGKQVRITKRTIAQLVQNTGYTPTFLENVDDVDKLLEKHNRPDAPLHSSGSVKDRLMNTYNGTKKIGTRIVEDGLFSVGKGVISGMDRAITNLRNKFVWYGSGLDQADFSRYNGQLRDSQERAVASIAVTNAIHAGHVGTQVMVQGGLEFNPESQQFMAVKRSKSMANVLKEKAKLVNQLGAQRAANVIQAYFEAKRSRSIINEYLEREDKYQKALDSGVDVEQAQKDLDNIERAASKVQMDDEQIDEFIALEEEYPELRAMMDNWTAVNQNMLDVLYFAGNLSKARYQALKAIKDYVPWYRIMEDQTDPHDFPTGGTTKTMTNVAREKMFKPGEVGLDIDDIVDNMIHNVMWMTKNAMRNYAANRVADEYGIRNEKGKLKVFPKEGTDSQGVKFNILRNGRRIVVGVADPLIAESVIGMENVEIPMNRILSIMANGLRRSITLSGAFQLKQLFMDAPTAAWVSGVKNPFAVWANTFISFGKVLVGTDPIAQKLRQAGIGGFQSTARTPEKELALEIGLLNKSMYARVLKVLDQIGDASDYAQRVAVYKQVLKETGDEAQALLQANNVIDFLKRGSGQTAQYLGRTVAFMNAYAQSVDVLATALAGGGLKGMDRKKAVTRMAITGTLLSFTTLLYCFAIGDDEEYEKMDDSTKLRNFVIPGTKQLFGETVALPMHTSASFIFKAIPELLYNTYLREGAKDEMDSRRFRKALKEAFMDSMLGPNVVPTGVKPFIELGLNRNFWTGTTVIPKGMEDLTAAEQYNAATSELGKVVSALTSVPGTEDKRLLSPIEADHLMRGLFGSAAAMAMWSTNLLAGDRPEGRVRDIPVIGSFVLPPVPRGREDLFYDLKDATDEKMKTYKKLLDREKFEEAEEYFDKNEGILGLYKYTNKVDNTLKKINKEIQRIGTASSDTLSPAERRERMDELGELKNDILEGIAERRTDVFDLADPLFLRKD